MNRKRIAQSFLRLTLTLCLTLSLCLDMSVPYLYDGQIAGFLANIQRSLTARGGLATPLFLLLLWANGKIDEKKHEFKILFPLVNGFIALIWLMGEGFRVDNTLITLHASLGQIVKSLIYFVGIAYGLNQITYFLYGLLEEDKTRAPERPLTGQKTWCSQIVRAYREHTILVSFAAIFIPWLPHLILSYPANLCWDAYDQLAQFLGSRIYANHHPVTSTVITGSLVKVGSLVSDNFGLFFCILVQAVVGALILARTLQLLRELNAPIWLRVLTYGCYIFVPYYTAYIGLILKDVPYSYAVLLFVVELVYFFVRNEDFFRSKGHVFLLTASIVGTLFFRNNGKHMLYPTIAAVLLYLIFRSRKSGADSKERRRTLAHAVAVLLVPVLLAEIIAAGLSGYLNAAPGSVVEALSLPLQQTARYVKEFGDEVTEEERAVISAVLDYDRIAEVYNPRLSDPVKNIVHFNRLTDEVKDYLRVWLKQFTKHPFTYVKATVNQNFFLLYPFIPNSSMYLNRISDSVGGDVQQEVLARMEFSDVEAIANRKDSIRNFYAACFNLPVVNVLSHPAFYVTLLIWLSLFAFYRKRFLWLLTSIPLWLSGLIVVLAPLVDARYVFPIIYPMPVLFAYFLYLRKEEKT